MITTQATLTKKYTSPSDYVALTVFQPERTFEFLEGQFMMIEAEIDGKIVKKPYSIATTNKQLQEKKELGFVVKKTSERGMSDWLTQKLEKGGRVTMKGPVGHYVDNQEFSNYLLVAVGSGLSPNVGLFEHIVYEQRQCNKLVNIFGERYAKHIIPEVERIFTNHDNDRVQNLFYLSQENNLPDGYQQGHVQDGLKGAIDHLGLHTSCFLCGKPEMVSDVQQQLIKFGIQKEQITFEKY